MLKILSKSLSSNFRQSKCRQLRFLTPLFMTCKARSFVLWVSRPKIKRPPQSWVSRVSRVAIILVNCSTPGCASFSHPAARDLNGPWQCSLEKGLWYIGRGFCSISAGGVPRDGDQSACFCQAWFLGRLLKEQVHSQSCILSLERHSGNILVELVVTEGG